MVDGFVERTVDSEALASEFSSARRLEFTVSQFEGTVDCFFERTVDLNALSSNSKAPSMAVSTAQSIRIEGTVDGFFERTVDSKALSSDSCHFRLFRPFGCFGCLGLFRAFRIKLLRESNI